jgi:hypothetical protein
MESASDEEISRKVEELINKLQLPIMEIASDEEISRKVQEIINKLQLPFEEFVRYKYFEEFNEQMENPGIAAQIQIEIVKKTQEITKNIKLAREKLEKSYFYEKFMSQMQNPVVVARIKKVIGTDPHHSQLQVVIYGVGEMNDVKITKKVEHCHMQLAFAILLREKFQWVNDIVVYDPVLSFLDRRAINQLDCTCLSVNEEVDEQWTDPRYFSCLTAQLFSMKMYWRQTGRLSI